MGTKLRRIHDAEIFEAQASGLALWFFIHCMALSSGVHLLVGHYLARSV